MPGFAALQAALPGAQGTPRADAQRLADGAPGDFAALIGAAGEAPLPAPSAEPVVAAQGQSTLSEHELPPSDLPPSDLPPSLAWLPAPIEALAVPGGLRPDGLAQPTENVEAGIMGSGIVGRVSGDSHVSRQTGALAARGGLRPDGLTHPTVSAEAAIAGHGGEGLTHPAETAAAGIVGWVSGESRVTHHTDAAPAFDEAADTAAQLLASPESRVPGPGIIGLAAATTELRASPPSQLPMPMPSTLLDATAPEFAGDLAERIVWQLEGGVGEAQIELHPAELGSISVRIETQGDQARVQIVAAEAATRALLSQALPQLRELLSGSGLQLARSSIDAERRAERGGERGATVAQMPGVRRRVTQVLLVDAYA